MLQPQLLPFEVVVVGVKNLRDVFGKVLLENGLNVIAVVEKPEVKVARRHGGPQPQSVDNIVAVARNGIVVRHGQNGLKHTKVNSSLGNFSYLGFLALIFKL